ncbi:unnamed protein product [Oppiella nova]|uniref:C2H2-type domain-containing protein n=1 Tax=Oppiella nova TaxID=334625 RepID=A0A7R9MF93_9ACAR|nr:unnamed protein product [Oppiella nova]CAG2175919.1 unnamed protein product [Oppiella nova]
MASNTRILVSNQTVTAPAMDYWFGIGLGVKTIADLKALLAANEGLSPQEVDLFLKNGFLRDETNVSILREEDVVSIKRKTRLDTNCGHQLVITSMSVAVNTIESFPPDVIITPIQELQELSITCNPVSNGVDTSRKTQKRSRRTLVVAKSKRFRCEEQDCGKIYTHKNHLQRHWSEKHSNQSLP